MADADPQLMSFVEEEMKKEPSISSKALFEKAKASIVAARDLTIREFHARYPLQVKRKASLAAGGGKRRRRRKTRAAAGKKAQSQAASRDAVRAALLQFASDLSAAEERKDLVRVLAEVDRYVDDVLKAANPS